MEEVGERGGGVGSFVTYAPGKHELGGADLYHFAVLLMV